MDTATEHRALVGDIELAWLERGEGPLVVCLHGFPDAMWSFEPLLDVLAGAGFRAVALAQRGYAPSGVPAGRTIDLGTLARDVVGLADHLGAARFDVVGHDWGAAVAYHTAAIAPDRVRRIVTAAVPHVGHFLTRTNPAQLWRSRYMAQFQVPVLPERLIERNGMRAIDALVRRWSPTWNPTGEQLAGLRRGMVGPGRVRAALAYYRGLARDLVTSSVRRPIFADTPVPTATIHGAADACVHVGRAAVPDRRFPAGVTHHVIPGVGHFTHLEAPDAFHGIVLGHLGEPPPA